MSKRVIDTIVIHCSATREDQDYTFEDCLRDHKARGFRKLGYHFFIRKDGTVHVGRSLNEIGAHAGKEHNASSIGICYEGGVKANGNVRNPKDHKDTRTAIQRTAMLNCILEVMNAFSIKRIVGHRDLSPDLDGDGVVEPHEWIKSCPCFDAIPEYKHLLT
jgi:N-acetylmuramoyl-L-alanine amidase